MAGRLDRGILTTLRLPVRLEAALTKHTVANLRAQRRPAADAAPTVDDLVATQMDRSYATAHRVMREARHRLPSYTPLRMLDFGASQSPMAWAAQASWPDVPLQVCAVEPNAALRQDGEQLCAAASTVPFHVHAPHWSEPIPGVHYDNRDDRDAKRYDARRARRRTRMVKVQSGRRLSSAPVPPQGTPGASGQLVTRGQSTGRPATASRAQASRLQSRRFSLPLTM